MNDPKQKPLTEDMPGYRTEATEPKAKPLTEDDPGFNLEEQEESEGLPPGTALTEAL